MYFLASPLFFRPNFFLSLYAKKISTPHYVARHTQQFYRQRQITKNDRL
ncbi:hypothetical protein MHA_1941 [Mannheimia haemolytica PHL213]|nr:hypothetical protein MHH_c06650 [Mannheimia haemolytica M42548]EDN74841.1 hypothetical protein MHA_1941 [Mannheimia haemolytica PHL213]